MAAFKTPKISLNPTTPSDIRTLPELVDFHAENNPRHLFCLQIQTADHFLLVSYERLQRTIVRCQAWLEEQSINVHPPLVDADGHVKKCAPVAILMESHVGLAIYVLACMGKGIPVVLLSARLSAPTLRHLIRETGARITLISPRLRPLAYEAFPAAKDSSQEVDEEGVKLTIRLVAEYEALLEEGEAADPGRPATCIAHQNHFLSEEDRQVLILHSSGTSGLPKPIPCSHRYFLGYATCHSFSSDEEAHGLTISTPPFFHVCGQRWNEDAGLMLIVTAGFWLCVNMYVSCYRPDNLHPSALHDSTRGIYRISHTRLWSESIADSAVDFGRN